jgi:hypothetical protein
LGRKKKVVIEEFSEEISSIKQYELDINIKDITIEEFEKYKQIKENGIIPLYKVRQIVEVTGLNSYKLTRIMDNYSYLYNKFINNNKKDLKK